MKTIPIQLQCIKNLSKSHRVLQNIFWNEIKKIAFLSMKIFSECLGTTH